MKPELQDVFKLYGDEFRETHRLPMNQLKTMSAIETCRSSSQGLATSRLFPCGLYDPGFVKSDRASKPEGGLFHPL